MEFVGASHDLPVMGTLRGHLWEGVCHSLLAGGVTFRMRRLDGASEELESLTIEACSSHLVFDDIMEVRSVAETAYCRPRRQNFAAVDSLRQPRWLYQITVAKRHGVNGPGLERAVECLQDDRSAICLLFVVPHTVPSFRQPANNGRSWRGGHSAIRAGGEMEWMTA